MTKDEFMAKLDGVNGIVGLVEKNSVITIKLQTTTELIFNSVTGHMEVKMFPFPDSVVHEVDDLDFFIEKHQKHLQMKGVVR